MENTMGNADWMAYYDLLLLMSSHYLDVKLVGLEADGPPPAPLCGGASVWLSGGRGFPRWWPVVRPCGRELSSSLASGRSTNPPWKLRSNSSQGEKVKGLSADNPRSLSRHPSSIAVRTGAGQWAGPQNICGARTWNPQKWRVPFWKTEH